MASEVFVIDEGGPVTSNGPAGSLNLFRDDVGASAAVGEDPTRINFQDLSASRPNKTTRITARGKNKFA